MNRNIKTISIIGMGFMGNAIAEWIGQFDYSLRLYDSSPEAQNKLLKITQRINRRKKKAGVLGEVSVHNNIQEAVSESDLIIECITENLELKQHIFNIIDSLAPLYSIIATNSSSIPVSKLEGGVKRKDKVLNIHFYAPISNNPMVDIMRGTQTSDETFEIGKKWIESIECTPLIVKKECLGFVFNRIWRAIKKECLKIWDGGYADIETVDIAWKIWSGMGMGPFKMMDAVGLDVIWDVEMQYYLESRNINDKPPDRLKEMIVKGNLGNKTGQGFYPLKKES